jgi:hypothetical protein
MRDSILTAKAPGFIGPGFIAHGFLGCSLAAPGCGELAEALGTGGSAELRTWTEY